MAIEAKMGGKNDQFQTMLFILNKEKEMIGVAYMERRK